MAVALCLVSATANPARAEDDKLEYAIKATFLYKFGPFVEWPSQVFDTPASAFNLCIIGEDPFGGELDDAVRGQTVEGHPVVIRRMKTVGKAPPCHVLYIGHSRQQPTSEILQIISGLPILTVTDERSGTASGIVHFVLRQGRVRFSIDTSQAQASGLAISSKLLGLAILDMKAGG